MKLSMLAGKLQEASRKMNDFISKEHTLTVTDSRLALCQDRIDNHFKEMGVEDVSITFVGEHIHVSGRFAQGGGGRFEVDLVPDEVRWTGDEHTLFFIIARQDVTLDNKLKNLIAGATAKVCNSLFGPAYLNRKAGIVDQSGRVAVPLDGQSQELDAVIKSIRVQKITCSDGKLFVNFKPNPKEALANSKVLLEWWRSRRIEQ